MQLMKIVSNYVYPSVRKRLVEILYFEYKLKQEDIAKILYISQSTVSRYLSGDRGKFLDLSKSNAVQREINELAKKVLRGGMDRKDLEYEISLICFRAMGRGDICQFHDQIDSNIDSRTCNLCKRLFGSFLASSNT